MNPIPPKPGYKTSEFWLTTIVQLLGILAASGVITTGSPLERIVGLAVTALATVGYSASRGSVKSGSLNNVGLLLICGLALTSLGGCGATPTARWAQQREALTTTQNLLAVAAQQGRLTDQQIVTIDKVVQAARAALQSAETQLPSGGGTFESYMQIVDAVIDRLIELQTRELKEHFRGSTDDFGDGQGWAGADRPGHARGGAGEAEGRDHRRAAGRHQGAGLDVGRQLGRDRLRCA